MILYRAASIKNILLIFVNLHIILGKSCRNSLERLLKKAGNYDIFVLVKNICVCVVDIFDGF